jgi:hypothetical protein
VPTPPPPAKRKRRRLDEAPSWRLLVLPFFVFGVASITAALHKVLGEPLGATVAAKLADIAQTLALMLVAYGPAMGYVQRQNALAAATEPKPARKEGADDNDLHG